MPSGKSDSSSQLYSPESRGYLHSGVQRLALRISLVAATILLIVMVPIMVNDELRLDIARQLHLVPDGVGEQIADGDSGASLLVLPISTEQATTDRIVYRNLAAFIAYPEDGSLRLEAINTDGELTVPFDEFDLVSTAPDGSQMFIAGPEGGAVIDVAGVEVIQRLEPGVAPDVAWDWETPVWMLVPGICDTLSMELEWIACFPRPALAAWFAGDWHLRLLRYGNSDERHDVMRGLGFRPTVGFSEDDRWMYIANERGVRRFDVQEITDS